MSVQSKDTVDSDHIIMYDIILTMSSKCKKEEQQNGRALTALLRGWIAGSSLRPVVATTCGPHLPQERHYNYKYLH